MAAQAMMNPERRRRADTVPPPARTQPLQTVAPAPAPPAPPAPAIVATPSPPVSNTTEPLPSVDFTHADEGDTTTHDQPPELVRVVRIQDRPHVLPTPVPVTPAPLPRTAEMSAARTAELTTRMSEDTQTRQYPRARSPVTVIPVPKLPTMSSQSYRPEPVVRTTPPLPRTAASVQHRTRGTTSERLRMAKGTGPVGDQTSPGIGIETSPGISLDTSPGISLDTSPGIAVDSDPTRPQFVMPRTQRTEPLPAVKRR
jgi:hypothetical protein